MGRAVDRDEHGARARRQRLQVRAGAAAQDVGEIDAGGVDARRGEQRVEPGRVGALGQPQPPVPPPEAVAVRRDPRVELEPQATVGGQQRQDRVGRRGRPGGVAAQPAQQVAADRGELRLRPLVGRTGVLQRSEEVRGPAVAAAGQVAPVGLAADVAQEGRESLPHARGAQLVAQHGRQRQRQERPRRAVGRVAIEELEQRQVARGHRLPQPLLAEGPGPEPLDVGHVGVQDERQLAPVARDRHGRPAARRPGPSSARRLTAGTRRGSPARRRDPRAPPGRAGSRSPRSPG